MKRPLYLILLAAVCALALAAVTSLSGCAANVPGSDPTGSTDIPTSSPAVTGEAAVYTSGYVDMALTLPEGWQWESVQDKSMGTEGIRFWKSDDKAVAFRLLCWRNGYGLCGTDLISEELTLSNGQTVWQHTYGQESFWLDLYFSGVPGDYVLEPDGDMTQETWDACRDEVLTILATAQFGREAMTEQEATDIAKAQYDGEYDMTYARYDVHNGSWTVTFTKGAMGQSSVSVVVKPDGTAALDTESAEK